MERALRMKAEVRAGCTLKRRGIIGEILISIMKKGADPKISPFFSW
jgi:hypothetical protein